MKLEQTFRKTLQQVDAQYRDAAFAALSSESRSAWAANSRLKEELAMQVGTLTSAHGLCTSPFCSLSERWHGELGPAVQGARQTAVAAARAG